MMQGTMELLGKIITNILTALYEPFGFSLLLSFMTMFFYLYAYEPGEAGKGWKSALVTWYERFKERVNPLSNVLDGWGIWKTVNGEQVLTTEGIENVIMMVPFTGVLMWTFEEKTGNGWRKILWHSGKTALIFSVSIETLQLLLRLGTFQLSDIFYNTVGGVIGGLMYYGIRKVRKRL